MKNTGVTRRIDNLGRIVIPKEFRKKLHINQGELLELYLNNEEIVLQKHDFITNKDNFLNTYVDILKQKLNTDVLITNLDKVVFSSNKDYLDKSLSKEFYNFINGNLNVSNFRNLNVVEGLNIDDKALVLPISPNADIVGYIVFMSLTNKKSELIDFSSDLISSYFEL